jgi:hypothetical protein
MGHIQGEDRQQSSLFPPTLEELLPEDHWVRVIEAYVARLSLQTLGFSKAQPHKTGGPPMTRRICSNSICTATFSASVPHADWRPSASAISK